MAATTRVSKMDRFERFVVFRIARGYFFLMAALAVIAVVASVVIAVFGFVRVPVAEPVFPPPPPPPAPLSVEDVQQKIRAMEAELAAAAGRQQEYAGAQEAQDRPPHAQPVAQAETEQERLLRQLRALFPDPPYAWEDAYKETRTCVAPSPYGCLQYSTSREKIRDGIEPVVKEAIRRVPDETEFARLMIELVAKVPVADRGKFLLPLADVFLEKNADRQSQVERHQAEVAALQAEYEAKVAEQQESKEKFKTYAMYGGGGGLALVIIVSLFLAHFAIERHLRLVQKLLEAIEARSMPLAATEVDRVTGPATPATLDGSRPAIPPSAPVAA